MSLLDDVSIVVTPNGYKAGELYAVIPSNGDADMDVTRTTAATRVDENGLVNYAEIVSDTELITNGDFSNGTTDWTSNAAATLSIDTGRLKIAISGAGSGYAHQTFTIESGKQYKCTGTIDFGTASQIRFYVSNTGQFFDITQSGNFDFTFTSTGTSTQVRLYTYGDGNYGFWDNISVKEVTRDNVPRIDYTGGGCPHILAEPQRTNLFTYSEDFTSGWNTSDATITANSTISPDGTQNASTLTTTASGGTVQESLSISDGDIAFSLFVKKGSTDGVRLRIDASTDFNAYFDLTDGTIHSTTGNAKIETLDNDWYKISVSASVTSFVKASIYTTDGTTSYDNGTVFIWGSQMEEGSYATSYIPTSGSTVTRNQDIFTRDGIGSLINSTEGCLFGEGNFAKSSISGYMYFASLSDGTLSNRLEVRQDTNNLKFLWRVGTYQSSITTSGVDVGVNFKFAVNYSSANIKFYVNGNPIGTISTPTLWSADTLNRLGLDDGGGGYPFFGKVKQLQVYDTALTDTQLAALTS